MAWSAEDVQTHSRALWVSFVNGVNYRAFLHGQSIPLKIDAKLGGFEQPLDLAREEDKYRLSDGSSARALYQAICRKVGYQSKRYAEEAPDVQPGEEQECRSTQREFDIGILQKYVGSFQSIFKFTRWRTVSFGLLGILFGFSLKWIAEDEVIPSLP